MAKLVETTYGEALFELAVQESKVDELCEEAQAVIDIFKDNEDLVNVLKSPKVINTTVVAKSTKRDTPIP